MIIATFNVENLFERSRAMHLPTWTEGQPALNAGGELNALFNRPVYRDADKRRMLHLLKKYGLLANVRRHHTRRAPHAVVSASHATPVT